MLQRIQRIALPLAGMALLLATAACGNISKVDRQGQTADPVWPRLADATTPEGIYPDPRQLAMVKPGMTKDQLYHLLGRPHFLEGFFFVREWDYLFHLQTPAGDTACQFKVLFDTDGAARSFLWREPACKEAAQAGASTPAGQQAEAEGKPQA